jgi:hypothetical protein
VRRIGKKLLLALIATVACLLLLEIAARRIKKVPILYFVNFVETRVSLMKSVFPTQYDAQLGWIPKPGDYTDSNYWGTTLRVLENGIRSNGGTNALPQRPVILAVGDSFTFGSQVGDENTWPAALERLTGVRVINGGVFAYGLDQSVLRAEQLVPIYKPDILIVSFISENVNRCERAVRTGAAKPYFDVVDGALQLRNVPVSPLAPGRHRIGLFRGIFGYSYLMDVIMRQTGRENYWYLGDWESRKAHSQGVDVCRLLMQRLADLSRRSGVKVIVLAQYQDYYLLEWQPPESVEVLKAALNNSLSVLDLYPALCEVGRKDAMRFRSFFDGHMTRPGNAFVADELQTYLREHHVLP